MLDRDKKILKKSLKLQLEYCFEHKKWSHRDKKNTEIIKKILKFRLEHYIQHKKWWQRPNHTKRAKSLIQYLETIKDSDTLWDTLDRSEIALRENLAPVGNDVLKHFRQAKDTRRDEYNSIITTYRKIISEAINLEKEIIPLSKPSPPKKKTELIEIELKTRTKKYGDKDENVDKKPIPTKKDRERTPHCFSNFLHQIRFSYFVFNKKHFSAPKESKEALSMRKKSDKQNSI